MARPHDCIHCYRAPLLYLAYYRYQHMRLGAPLVSFVIGILIPSVTMILRRRPKRITPNPLHWQLAFVAAYLAVPTLGIIQKAEPVVSNLVSDAVEICSLAAIVWARLSLGRNIGFVPAQRVVTSGAYRYVRHPIYTGLFLGSLGIALRAYSPRKLRLLRAHGLIYKIPKTHRYQVSKAGRVAILTVLAVQQTSLAQLNLKAAA